MSDNPFAPSPPLPPPPPTYRKWRIDRIVLKNEKAWQELLDTMTLAEIEGWDIETLEFHDVRIGHHSATKMMSILVMSREETRDETSGR